SACSKVVDVVFVLDASGSIPEDDFQRILNFVRDLASRLDVESKNARVAVVTFSDNPEAVFYLNSYDQTADITLAIQGIEYTHGSTNMAGAWRFVREVMFSEANGARVGVEHIALIITDGESDD
ncbi:hypothetical protein CAPTEDRAFT_47260, partial [Capitella teleta]